MTKYRAVRRLTPKQLTSQKINQINFCLHGIRSNLKAQRGLLISASMHKTAYDISILIDRLDDTIQTIKSERLTLK